MPHRITCYSRAYFTNIPNHKIVYAVKNIVKEERWSCLSVLDKGTMQSEKF